MDAIKDEPTKPVLVTVHAAYYFSSYIPMPIGNPTYAASPIQ